MNIIELLKTIGLNKYESAAYLQIINLGVGEASEIYKEAQIPFGKIYEVLTSLEQLNLIEVQNSRPKKYRAINPEIAYEKFLNNQKNNYDNKINNISKNLSIIKKEIMKDFDKTLIEKKFWKSAIEDEALDLMEASFAETKEELIIFTTLGNTHNKKFEQRVPIMINLIEKLLKNKIKVRTLIKKEDLIFFDTYSKTIKDYNNLQVKCTRQTIKNSFFLIDGKEVLFPIENPVEEDQILGIIKIEDKELINRLYKHFNQLWKKGEIIED